MKILKILTIIAMAIFLFTTCEKDRTKYEYKGETFFHFEDRSYTAMENDKGVLSVNILLSSPQTTAITVNFSVSTSTDPKSKAIVGVDYNLLTAGNSVTFEAGETMKSIDFSTIDNIVTGDTTFKVINIAITDNTAGINDGLPGPDGLNSTTQIIIKDDDCPLTMTTFKGKVKGTETSPWWTDAPNEYNFKPIEELAPNVIKYEVTGFWYNQLLSGDGAEWYAAGESYTFYPVIFIIDYSDVAAPTCTIEAGKVLFYDWVTSNNTYYVKGEENKALKISTCERTLAFDYTMTVPSWASGSRFKLKFKFE